MLGSTHREVLQVTASSLDLRRLIIATARVSGTGDFHVLVRVVGEVFGKRVVVLGEITQDRSVRVLAAWGDAASVVDYALEGTPCAVVVATGLPLTVESGLALAFPVAAGRAAGNESYLGVPIRGNNDQFVGVLMTMGPPCIASEADEEILSACAQRAGSKIELARAMALDQRRTQAVIRRQRALTDLAQLRNPNFDAALEQILPIAARTIEVERASFWSLTPDGGAIVLRKLFDASAERFASEARIEAGGYPRYFAALRTRSTIAADDARTDPRTNELVDGYMDKHGIESMLDVPVWHQGRTVGVLCLEHVGPMRRWSEGEVDFARAVAHVVSLSLHADARARAEERYDLVSRASAEVLWDRDLRTDLIEWSDALERVLGHTVEQSRSTSTWWLEHLHPLDRARVETALTERLASDAETWNDEYRFQRADGSTAQIADRGIITRDPGGRPLRMVGAMRDESTERSLEARLMLADRMASMGQLAAGVAHEINNPLTYVRGNIEYALAELAGISLVPPQITEALAESRIGAIRIQEIVRDLSTFARPDPAGDAPVDIDKVAESACSMARNQIKYRARLVKRLTGPPAVMGSEARLGQVLLNLLVNAAQALPVGASERNQVTVESGVADDGRVFVSVRDTGSGMTPEILPHIFEPFFTTKAVGEGTGLGLAISHAIVTSMNGELTVESAPGRGTVFRVNLQAVAGAVVDAEASAPPRPSVARARILVIDDNPLVARIVMRALERDHHVELSLTGQGALDRLALGEVFDVIVCDVMMPAMSGMEFHAELERSRPALARRVLFLTGGAFARDAREFLASTAQPWMSKPFAHNELREAVEKLLAR